MSSKPLRWLAAVWVALLSFGPQTARATIPRSHPILVGYFPQWGVYAQPKYLVKNLVSSGAAADLDQLNYAQGFVSHGRCSVADPHADLDLLFSAIDSLDGRADDPTAPVNGNFHQLAELKRLYPHLRLLISLEGRASDFALGAQPENRERFVRSCIDTFIRGQFARGRTSPGLFAGFDIDWEYPREQDRANFLALVQEFRRQLDAVRRGLWLEVAGGPLPQQAENISARNLCRYVNAIGVMNYDYNGPWNKTTGLIAPLFRIDGDPRPSDNVADTMAAYRQAGVPSRKLILGLPFYGYAWQQVVSAGANHGLFMAGRAAHGDHPYHEIASLLTAQSLHRDARSGEPWFYDGSTFWTYDDPISIRRKMVYVRRQHMGGAMIWDLSGDTADAQLVRAARAGLAHSPRHELRQFEAEVTGASVDSASPSAP